MNARTLIFAALICGYASHARAGYFELSGNGSYYKYNNGLVNGEASYTTSSSLGAGFAYRFLENTAIEFNYTSSETHDTYSQDTAEILQRLDVLRITKFKNASVSLVLDFAPKNSSFRPFIKGGAGYTWRQTITQGIATDKATTVETPFLDAPTPSKSASAQGGIGFKIFIVDRIAIEGTYTLIATDLDKKDIYLHYSVSGGLRFVF